MTIDEAIERLQTRINGDFPFHSSDPCIELQLGIEALKRLKKCRQAGYKFYCQLMPGETKK